MILEEEAEKEVRRVGSEETQTGDAEGREERFRDGKGEEKLQIFYERRVRYRKLHLVR